MKYFISFLFWGLSSAALARGTECLSYKSGNKEFRACNDQTFILRGDSAPRCFGNRVMKIWGINSDLSFRIFAGDDQGCQKEFSLTEFAQLNPPMETTCFSEQIRGQDRDVICRSEPVYLYNQYLVNVDKVYSDGSIVYGTNNVVANRHYIVYPNIKKFEVGDSVLVRATKNNLFETTKLQLGEIIKKEGGILSVSIQLRDDPYGPVTGTVVIDSDGSNLVMQRRCFNDTCTQTLCVVNETYPEGHSERIQRGVFYQAFPPFALLDKHNFVSLGIYSNPQGSPWRLCSKDYNEEKYDGSTILPYF